MHLINVQSPSKRKRKDQSAVPEEVLLRVKLALEGRASRNWASETVQKLLSNDGGGGSRKLDPCFDRSRNLFEFLLLRRVAVSLKILMSMSKEQRRKQKWRNYAW